MASTGSKTLPAVAMSQLSQFGVRGDRMGTSFEEQYAAAADRILNPHRWTLAPVFEREPVRVFTSHTEALDWLSAELPVLRSCVRAAHDSGRHSVCWQLCETLRNLFTLRKHYVAWEESYTVGLASARALADPAAEACMLLALGDGQRSLGRPEPAGTPSGSPWRNHSRPPKSCTR